MKREKNVILILSAIILVLLITGFTTTEIIHSRPVFIPVQKSLLEPVSLASASEFSVLTGSGITHTGKTDILGRIGVSPGSLNNEFSEGIISRDEQLNSSKITQAKLDLIAAYDDAETRRSKYKVVLNGNIGGLTLTPGLYNSTSSLVISSGDLTFDAIGNPNAVFIIQVATKLSTWPETKVILKRNAKASNIFWQVGETAVFGSNSIFKGTVMALKSIKFYNGASLEGRGLSRFGEVILCDNNIE
jgi:hypothetical protein